MNYDEKLEVIKLFLRNGDVDSAKFTLENIYLQGHYDGGEKMCKIWKAATNAI